MLFVIGFLAIALPIIVLVAATVDTVQTAPKRGGYPPILLTYHAYGA